MKTELTYFACVKCYKIGANINDFARIVSGFEMVSLWCKDCVAKSLNTTEVTN